jgi:hypothetical protein
VVVGEPHSDDDKVDIGGLHRGDRIGVRRNIVGFRGGLGRSFARGGDGA